MLSSMSYAWLSTAKILLNSLVKDTTIVHKLIVMFLTDIWLWCWHNDIKLACECRAASFTAYLHCKSNISNTSASYVCLSFFLVTFYIIFISRMWSTKNIYCLRLTLRASCTQGHEAELFYFDSWLCCIQKCTCSSVCYMAFTS